MQGRWDAPENCGYNACHLFVACLTELNLLIYAFARSLLFRLPPETAHDISLRAISLAHQLGLSGALRAQVPESPVTLMGLTFPNPVGLAAGLDKNASAIDGLAALGFGFIEVGTVTPRAQPGNPAPRLFRLPAHQAIINRMGFNNLGLGHLVEQLRRRKFQGIVGVNVGKNADTPVEAAASDYRQGMAAVYPWASYLAVNLSSPNTPGLRSLQFGDNLLRLLDDIKAEQRALQGMHGRYVPVVVKIAPDMNEDAVNFVAQALLNSGMDGVIATNTTIDHSAVADDPLANETGGLSGAPLRAQSTLVIRQLARALAGRLPIIGVGGITDGASAAEKIAAGASLVQIYTGFIYRGPALIREAALAIAAQ